MFAIVAALALVGLAGCGGGDGGQEPGDETKAAAVAHGTIPVGTPGLSGTDDGSSFASPVVGDVVWASAIDPATNAPRERVDRFSADVARLYAVVDVAGLPIGAVVRGAWTYNGVAMGELDAEVAITAPTAQPTWIEFHLERTDDRWPEGTYEIAIGVDGEVLRTASVEVSGAG